MDPSTAEREKADNNEGNVSYKKEEGKRQDMSMHLMRGWTGSREVEHQAVAFKERVRKDAEASALDFQSKAIKDAESRGPHTFADLTAALNAQGSQVR